MVRTNLVKLVKSTVFGKLSHVLTTRSLKNIQRSVAELLFLCSKVFWLLLYIYAYISIGAVVLL